MKQVAVPIFPQCRGAPGGRLCICISRAMVGPCGKSIAHNLFQVAGYEGMAVRGPKEGIAVQLGHGGTFAVDEIEVGNLAYGKAVSKLQELGASHLDVHKSHLALILFFQPVHDGFKLLAAPSGRGIEVQQDGPVSRQGLLKITGSGGGPGSGGGAR